MGFPFFWSLKNIWPFSARKFDDLRISHDLVRKLSIPEHTKQFVFAIPEPETQSVVYILSAQSLSERSVLDAECLIREVRPDAVVTQIGHLPLTETKSEETELGDGVDDPVPTSSFGVLKRCFVDKINKEEYENVAGNFVLREIFGIGFHGHRLAAKKVAAEVNSSFLVLQSPFTQFSVSDNPSSESHTGSKFQTVASSLVPPKLGPVVSPSMQRLFCVTNDVQSQMVKSLSSYMDLSVLRATGNSVSEAESEEIQPRNSYEAPSFAQTIYPLLVDLHNLFVDLPSIGRALAHSQKLLSIVNRGEVVDTQIISEVYTFKIAVEALRIALNNAGKLPVDKTGNQNTDKVGFSELSIEDKSHVLFAQALRSQTKKFKTIVAVVDASALAGLRKHWNAALPPEVKDLVEQLVTDYEADGDVSSYSVKKRLLADKPVVAVGAGATAVLGASSFSKVVPASTVMKIVTFKVPASLKLFLTQTQKVVTLVFGKTLGPTKVVAPGITSSGSKTASILKATASTKKIRAVAHSVIASAEKTSFSAMRTAFYEIMRKRRVQPIGFLPWATFGCSIATCTGLLVCGDGIECVAESLPAAPSIASLGRGIQSLRQASQVARETDGSRVQKSIESLTYRFKKIKTQ